HRQRGGAGAATGVICRAGKTAQQSGCRRCAERDLARRRFRYRGGDRTATGSEDRIMKVWWAGLAPRERVILCGGGVLLTLVLLYLLIWEPIAEQREQVRADIGALSADLLWMQQMAGQVKRLAAQQGSQTSTGSSGGSLLTLVEVSARAAGIN